MPTSCMAPGCTNRGYDNKAISFHKLPLSNPEKLKIWLNKMKLKNPPVNKYSRICSEHFHTSCFTRDLKAELMGSKPRKILNEDAVPTIFDFSWSIYETGTINAKPSSSTMQGPVGDDERGERMRNRTLKRSITEIHQTIDLMIQENVSSKKWIEENVCNESEVPIIHTDIEDNLVPDRKYVSVETQTDPTFIQCSAPCCNGQATKKNFPLLTSTPVKSSIITDHFNTSFVSTISDVSSHRGELDLSFQPSESDESGDMIEDDILDEEPVVDPIMDLKYIVFNNQLKQLFLKCQGDHSCAAPIVELNNKRKGSMLIVEGMCLNHHKFTWRSQPVKNRMAMGNLLLAASVLYTGNTYKTSAEIFETLNLQYFSETEFYYLQKKYLLPVINAMWKSHQEQILAEYEGDMDLIVAGDGRCDSPGHCATFGTYSLMDTKTNVLLATNVVKVTEVKNSYNMEKEGLVRCLNQLYQAGVNASTLATDRHPQITKHVREAYPDIKHQYDVWHIGKSIKKRLTAAAKRKECYDLQPWVRSVGHHLWWCADTCNGDATELKERWLSIMRHIVNKHEWTVASQYHKCEHPELTGEEKRNKSWLKPGTPSHKALQGIVSDKRLLKDMEKITDFCHTGDLEVFHNVLLKYLPKRIAFSYEGTVARTFLAALDNNTNVGREHACTVSDEKRWKVQWSKGSQRFVVKKINNQKEFTFRKELMYATLDMHEAGTEQLAIDVPNLARNIIGKGNKPLKSDAVEGLISRLRNN